MINDKLQKGLCFASAKWQQAGRRPGIWPSLQHQEYLPLQASYKSLSTEILKILSEQEKR